MKWISIQERLPESEGYYLTCTFSREKSTTFFFQPELYKVKIQKFFIDEIKTFFNVDGYITAQKRVANPRFEEETTHWMPLPKPPEIYE